MLDPNSIPIIPLKDMQERKNVFKSKNNRRSNRTFKIHKKYFSKRKPSINIKPKNKNKSVSLRKTDLKSKSEPNYHYLPNVSYLQPKMEIDIKEIMKASHDLPKFENAKTVVKNYGKIHSFVVNTNKGIIRDSNEDRVSIFLNA